MPETAGGAAWLVDPFSVASVKEGLERIVFDQALRANLIEAGAIRASLRHRKHSVNTRFHWQGFATSRKVTRD
jgi:hypothetical protein